MKAEENVEKWNLFEQLENAQHESEYQFRK